MNLVLYCLKRKPCFISPFYRLPRTIISSVKYCSRGEDDYYKVLGVGRQATTIEIRDAFIDKSKKLHPDRNRNDPNKHNQFVRLNQAYTILSDSKTREEYDAQDFQGKKHDSQDFQRKKQDYEDGYESANVRARRMKNEHHQYHNAEWIRWQEYMERTGYVDGNTFKRIAVPLGYFVFIAAVVPFIIMGRRIGQESNRRWEEKTRDLSCRPDERKLLKNYFLSLTGTKQRILCDLPDEEFLPELGRQYLISKGKTPEKQEPSKFLSRHDEVPQNQTYSGHTKKLGGMVFDLKAKGMDINPAEKKILKTYFQSLSGGQQRYLDKLNKEEFFTEIGRRYVQFKGIKIDKEIKDIKDLKDIKIPVDEIVDELTLKG